MAVSGSTDGREVIVYCQVIFQSVIFKYAIKIWKVGVSAKFCAR